VIVLQYGPPGQVSRTVKRDEETIQVRRALPADAQHIARLVRASAEAFLPALFGPGIPRALEEMAAGRGTLFSHQHAWVAEGSAGVCGMLLGYPGAVKGAQDPRTGLALLGQLRAQMVRRLPALLTMQSTIGRIGKDEYYVSNVAVYPQFRGRGIGSLLIDRAREEAVRAGASVVVLDVETDNPAAQRLYERLGFRVTGETPALFLAGHHFAFRRMSLALGPG
jgi:ribosomal protein S18 acetylase RimI-like enzyme